MAEGPYRIRKHCPDEWEVYGPAVPSHYGSKSAVTYGRNRQNAIHAAARREAIEECIQIIEQWRDDLMQCGEYTEARYTCDPIRLLRTLLQEPDNGEAK